MMLLFLADFLQRVGDIDCLRHAVDLDAVTKLLGDKSI